MTNATNPPEVHPDLVDELLQAYDEAVQAYTELIDGNKNNADEKIQLQVTEWEVERTGILDAIEDRKFRKLVTNDRGEYYQKKIDLADMMITILKVKEEQLTDLILKQHPYNGTRLEVAQWRIDRFNTRAAIQTQEFNKSELILKCDAYKARINEYRQRVKTEWNPMLNKIKKRIDQLKKERVPLNTIEAYRNALARADQPFMDEEEKIEYFIGLENLAAE